MGGGGGGVRETEVEKTIGWVEDGDFGVEDLFKFSRATAQKERDKTSKACNNNHINNYTNFHNDNHLLVINHLIKRRSTRRFQIIIIIIISYTRRRVG